MYVQVIVYVYLCCTDCAKDTSDTTTHSDWSDGVTMEVEYEVASLSEKENPLGDGTLSSDTDVSYTFQRSH
jgi:hypothetical protein